MKRVLVLNHFAGEPSSPGGTRHIEMFSRLSGWRYLIAVGNHSTVRSRASRSSVGYVALPTIPFSGNGLDRIANWVSYTASSIAHLSTGRRPGVVYASSPHLLTGLSGWLLARRWRTPFVLEIRDLWPQVLVDMGQMQATSWSVRALTRLEQFLYSEADRIVVMAEGTRDHLIARGIEADRIEFIPNAADPDDFQPTDSREALRARFGFSRFTCVYTGAHGPANGLGLLLEAAQQLEQEDVDVVLVGTGPSKPALQQHARELGLTNVRFFEPIAKSQIPDLMSAADVGLHVLADVPLFRYGVSPNKVFDYLASGLPMVTNVPGEVGDLVELSGGGVTVAPDCLADGIRALAHSSEDQLHAMSIAGRAFMKQHRSRTAMTARLQTLLDGLVAS